MIPYAVVNDTPHEAFPEVDDPALTEASLHMLSAAPRLGEFLVESDDVADEMYSKLLAAWHHVGDRFPDHLARNLLIACGAGAAMRRKGDNAARMDIALGPPWPVAGCAEVEFGDLAVLDAPRGIIDDAAVSIGRFGQNKDTLVTIVVTDTLPNKRSEYWRIIQDIHNVLDLSIWTVTVLALCLLVWRGKRLADLPDGLFYVDVDSDSYRASVLEPLLGRALRIGMAPRPWVDVAK